MRTQCTFLPAVTTNITTRSLSCGTTSCRSTFVKKRSDSGDWSSSPTSTVITSLTYFFRWEAVHPPPENPPEIVLISLWTGISCPWSPTGITVVGTPWFSCKYSFRKPFLTNSSSWNPNAKQLCRLWPKAWWSSHQVSLLGPSLLSVFSGDFSLSAMLGMTISSLWSIRKLCLVGVPSFVCTLVWGFLVSYDGWFLGAFFFVVGSCTRMGWEWPVPQGRTGQMFPPFSVTSSSATMWATTLWQISLNVFGRHFIRESLKGPGSTPHLKACTIISSSLVCSFTTSASNLLRKSFKGSLWYCLTSKRSNETGAGAWLKMYCSFNNVENWSNEVMCPSGRLMNQSNVVPENVPINSLLCMTSVPHEIIIWVWKVVMWASGSSTPVKVIFVPMKLAGITESMIAWENGMGRALTGMGGVRSSVRCKSPRNSSLALHNSSLFARDAA